MSKLPRPRLDMDYIVCHLLVSILILIEQHTTIDIPWVVILAPWWGYMAIQTTLTYLTVGLNAYMLYINGKAFQQNEDNDG